MFDPLQIPNVWRAESLSTAQGTVVLSGFEALDAALGGGWPAPALIELLTDVYGIGELQLILPLLVQRSRISANPALVLWLNPPYQLNAIALAQHGLSHMHHWVEMNLSEKDTWWSTEQALRSGACAAVVAWADAIRPPSLRRLKLAVTASQSVAILYRPLRDADQASPATIRARLTPQGSQLQVSLLKVQGRRSRELTIDIESRQLQQILP